MTPLPQTQGLKAWSEKRWELRATYEAFHEKLSSQYHLICLGCNEPSCTERTYSGAPPLNCADWPACPEYLRGRSDWQYIVGRYNAKNVSPLTGWPVADAAWAYDALCALEAAMAKKSSADMKAATKGGPGPPPRGAVARRRGKSF